MLTKHIDKTKKDSDNSKDGDPKDEGRGRGTVKEEKPSSQDPMDLQDRIITFTNRFSNFSKADIVREKSKRFKDQMKNTDQYFRFANGAIREKMERLERLKEDHKRFQNTVDDLQNRIKSRFELDGINPKYITPGEAKSLVFHLDEEFERLKDKLLYQELIVQKTKDEIARKRKQIQQIKEDLRDLLHNKPTPVQNDPITILKIELRKAGVSEASRIFQILEGMEEDFYSKSVENQKV